MDFNQVDNGVWLALAIANQRARESGSEKMWPEHIALSLLARPTGGAAAVFQALAIDLEETVRDLMSAMPKRRGPAGMGKLPMSQSAKSIIDACVAEAIALQRRIAGSEHLLLAFLSKDDSVAAKTLRDVGMTYESVRWHASRLPPTLSPAEANEAASRERRLQMAEQHRVRQLQDYMARRDEAQRIRRFVNELAQVAANRGVRIAASTACAAWLRWAQERADRLDPINEILSGCLA